VSLAAIVFLAVMSKHIDTLLKGKKGEDDKVRKEGTGMGGMNSVWRVFRD
jgi:hypothetical protein